MTINEFVENVVRRVYGEVAYDIKPHNHERFKAEIKTGILKIIHNMDYNSLPNYLDTFDIDQIINNIKQDLEYNNLKHDYR